MKRSGLLFVVAALVLFAAPLPAQTNPDEAQGIKPYDSWHGGDLDSISMTNGGLSLHIPLASFPQRGNLDLSFFVGFSNKQWYILPPKYDRQGNLIAPASWAPMPNTGVQIVSSLDWWLNTCGQAEMADPNNPGGQTLYDWSDSVTSPDGSTHTFGDQTAAFSPETFPVRSLDSTGLLRPDSQTLTLPNGTRYTYTSASGCASPLTGRIRGGAQASSVTDANGNQITISSSGWTDTMGRFIPGSKSTAVQGIQPGVSTTDLSKCPAGTTSALIWSIPGVSTVNAGVRTFYFCYSPVSLYTDFDSSTSEGAVNYGPVSTPLLSAVILPDLTSWTFTYDHFGDVLQAGFPTGGSLNYTYTRGPFGTASDSGFSTWTATRTVDANDGTGPHEWTYNYQGNFPTGTGTATYGYSQKGVATITDPEGNDVVYAIGPGGTGGCPGYVYQTQYFQGSAASNVVLKTVQTQYDCTMGAGGGNLSALALNVVPIQVTTTWPGGKISKVVNGFDLDFNDPNGQPVRVGSLLQRDEYDFFGALVRSTLHRYWWQDSSTFFNDNFVALPEWTTVYNGAAPASTTLPACSSTSNPACVSQTKYTYDEGSRASSGIGAPTHVAPPAGDTMRGNLTTLSRWLNTANAFVSATSTYFDTGMKASSTDPLGRATTYSYSSAFQGAYLTQTNMPDTQMPDSGAPVVQHIISGNYDFNTGLLTSFTDENGQPFSYSYDIMLRLTQGNHPDQGETVFTYPDPNTVIRQRLISPGVWEDPFTAKFDGVGRTYQTLQATPSGTVEVDTIYDSMGRVSTVSNPYYQGAAHSSDPTYGVTTNHFDALSRTTQTTKQDGSVSQVQYNQAAGDGDTTVDCTIATDEAGKNREVCSDGLGRMVKVLEPNPGAAATDATGSIIVSGTEQSATSQPATSGTGSVNIISNYGGIDGSTQFCTTRCVTIHDTGTVTITVNGHPETYTYGAPDTAATIAWHLSCDFHSDAASPVDAPCPASAGASTAVSLTAYATGAATNYSLSATSSSNDSADFTPPSFTTTTSGSTLTGGQNASTIADSGSVTATVNGTAYTVSYGSGDTPTSIALSLASAIAAGSWANATASGGTVNLTSKTPGTAGDYSLSASYTWNSTQFTNPSFTTSTSGSSLAGALDANALNNQPYVTVYQYDALNNMVRVDQKGNADSTQWRTRTFTYDSLSRLITAHNPENGTMCYGVWSAGNCVNGYDADGNLLAKTDGRNITITYAYDALNRLTDKSYNDGVTPTASYRYDYSTFLGQTFAYPIGREVATMVAGGTPEAFTSYDQMGRVKQSTQCNPGVTPCNTFTAGYDLLGDVTSMAYPSGLSVTYQYDQAARLYGASDSAGWNYASLTNTSQTYMLPSGAMGEIDTPNFKYTNSFNNRLQPTEIAATMTSGTVLFDKAYVYNAPSTSLMNNGNIYTVTNLKDSTRTQTFTYDVLNRLATAQDAAHWYNSYVYDAWGNLTQKNKGALPAGENMSTSADTGNHLLGYSYDAGGNVTGDSVNTYVYDGENRVSSVAGVSYTYDADGRRVKKSSGTNYWYGPSGEAMAETDSAGVWTNYVFFGGSRLARNVNGDIKYYITDHLHSTAVFADKSGTVLDDNDFYPWGGVVPGVGQTTSNNSIKFTGKYRDTESGLDYFGARYYANVMGRFMSPDWAAKPVTVPFAEFGDPQSLNLYSYVRNSPIVRVDADGHMAVGFTGSGVFYVGGYGVNDPMGGLPDPNNVSWVNAWITTIFTYSDGSTTAITHPGEVALSSTGEWANQMNHVYAQALTHFVSISRYPTGAAGFGHTGVAVDSDNTEGFSTKNTKTPILLRMFWFPKATVENDLVQHTDKDTGAVAPHRYFYIKVTADQAKAMRAAIDKRTHNAGRYNLFFNNCADYVGYVLHAGGIQGVPYREMFEPLLFDGLVQAQAH